MTHFMKREVYQTRRSSMGIVRSTCKSCGTNLDTKNQEWVVPIRFKSKLFKPIGCERCTGSTHA